MLKKSKSEIVRGLDSFVRKDGKQLDTKEKLFILEYLTDFDAGKAGINAGYAESMAKSKCFRWVSSSPSNPKPYIFAIIQRIVDNVISKKASTAERVIQELSSIAFADVGNYYAKLGRKGVEIDDFKKLPPLVRRAVESIEATPNKDGTYSFKFKLHSKTRALEILTKVLGISKENLHITGEITHNVKVVSFVVPMFENQVKLPEKSNGNGG